MHSFYLIYTDILVSRIFPSKFQGLDVLKFSWFSMKTSTTLICKGNRSHSPLISVLWFWIIRKDPKAIMRCTRKGAKNGQKSTVLKTEKTSGDIVLKIIFSTTKNGSWACRACSLSTDRTNPKNAQNYGKKAHKR